MYDRDGWGSKKGMMVSVWYRDIKSHHLTTNQLRLLENPQEIAMMVEAHCSDLPGNGPGLSRNTNVRIFPQLNMRMSAHTEDINYVEIPIG